MKQNDTELLEITDDAVALDVSARRGGPLANFDRWVMQRLLQAAGNPPVAITLGEQTVYQNPGKPLARLILSDRGALFRMIVNPDLQFGELYSSARLQVEGDLITCLTEMTLALPDYPQRSRWSRFLSSLYLLKRNTLSRARDNIYHHYDISNDFYQLWLDERMLYTCAYFPTPDTGLEEAQLAKMDHVCRKLRLQADEEVVEAGCGWGALALHMAKHYGVKVKAYNISKEQLAFARERAAAEGMSDRVEYIEGDYREIRGGYDAFVSVGMLEHVGLHQYADLGRVIHRCLRSHGRGLIHSIGRNRPAPVNAWIAKRIFPGGYTPSPSEISKILEPFRFSLLDMENLRLHYALTLRHWLQRFEQHQAEVLEMFDEEFVRAWRLYLAGSTAAFLGGELQLFQVVFARHDNNQIPLTRDFLYRSSESAG